MPLKSNPKETQMPKILRFRLSGAGACFRIPDTAKTRYFTYPHIHRPALLGLFGAIAGLGGYAAAARQGKNRPVFPEYYSRFSDLHFAVCPKGSAAGNGNFPKSLHIFNNSTGLASGEAGGILQFEEQILEKPEWEIVLLLDCPEAEKIASMITGGECVFVPYLGKNDFPAEISDAVTEEAETAESAAVCSLRSEGTYSTEESPCSYEYAARLPYELDEKTNLYCHRNYIYSDETVRAADGHSIYRLGNGDSVLI